MTRMSAARLAEIERINAMDMSTIQPGYHPGVIRELLAELREVTRERDEAQRKAQMEFGDLLQERERLAAEVAKYKAVSSAAEVVNMLLEYSGLPAKEWRVNGHIALSTAAIGKLREALAALDGRDEKGKGV